MEDSNELYSGTVECVVGMAGNRKKSNAGNYFFRRRSYCELALAATGGPDARLVSPADDRRFVFGERLVLQTMQVQHPHRVLCFGIYCHFGIGVLALGRLAEVFQCLCIVGALLFVRVGITICHITSIRDGEV